MALLDSVLEVKNNQKSGTGGNYLNPGSIDKDSQVRITYPWHPITRRLRVLGTKEGKRFSMKFKTEPTRDDLKERADEEGVELTGDEEAQRLSTASGFGTTKRKPFRSSSSASRA